MQTFGPYEVLEQVAVGSTGTVYRARHVEIDRVVAIKELSPELRGVPGLVERFRAEAHMLADLDDPHVVAIYTYTEEADRAWLALEWVDGAALSHVLSRHGRLTPEQSLGVLRGGLQGLAYAHDRGLVHGDMAPGNVLLDGSGTSKLVDFGLAAPVGQTGVCGTPAFVSPEAAAGQPVGKPGDVYSAAAVLFMLLSGRPPFVATDPAMMLRKHQLDPPPVLEGHGTRLADLVGRALSKDAATRPADARAFLVELEEAAAERHGSAWLERASVAGAVASTVAALGGAAGVGAGAAASAAPVGQTVSLMTAGADTGLAAADTAATHAEPRPRRRFRRPRSARGLAALAGVVLVTLGGGTVGTLALVSNQQEAARERAARDRALGIGVPPDAVVGSYRLTSRILSTNYPGAKVGTVETFTWTVPLRCTARICTGQITSSSGSVWEASFDGKTLTANKAKSVTEPCGDEKGKPVAGSKGTYVVTSTATLTVSARDQAGRPTGFEGTSDSQLVVTETTPGCTKNGPYRDVSAFTLSRLPRPPVPSPKGQG